MNKYENISSYIENGFVIIRSVLCSDEVRHIRNIITKLRAEKNYPRMILPDVIIKNKELYDLPFAKKIVDNMRYIFDDLTYITDHQLQINMFGIVKLPDFNQPGWHCDSRTESPNKYLMDADYNFGKCGIFFQDNTREWGGGIKVVEKGHKFPIKIGKSRINFLFKNIQNRKMIKQSPITLDIKAGDAVIFDSRLPHASTRPENLDNEIVAGHISNKINTENSKYVLYWNACSKTCADDFIRNSQKRAKKEDQSAENFFSTYSFREYPSDYPKEFVNLAVENGINIGSLRGG